MQLGRVVGTATATVKHESMVGAKLLVVQPLLADRRRPDGFPVLAIDQLGAGRGEMVLLTSDGKSVRGMLGHDRTPVRWAVIGLEDEK